MVGESTVLGCHLSPEKSAEDMEVRWFRSQFSPAVLLYKGGYERPEEQMEEYRGRTTFVSDDIGKGRVALAIHNVTAHDDGAYRCYFQQGRSYDQAVMRLVVAGGLLPFGWLLCSGVSLGGRLAQNPPSAGPNEWVRCAVGCGHDRHAATSAVTVSGEGAPSLQTLLGRLLGSLGSRRMRCAPSPSPSAGLGSTPLIEMTGYEDGGLRLECTSAGWFPEPRAVWRDPYGEVVPALEEACTADADGLFRVTTAVVVRDCSVRNMSCSVNNTLLGQEKDAVIFIPGSSLPHGRPWRGCRAP